MTETWNGTCARTVAWTVWL